MNYDAPMSLHTSFRIGGKAEALAVVRSKEHIMLAVKLAKEQGFPLLVMGNGSNMLVRDTGVTGLVLKIADGFCGVKMRGSSVVADAGARLITLSRDCIQKGLKGLHFAGGIPGTLGGAVAMNAGAYGGQIADVFVSALCLEGLEEVKITKEQAAFDYRSSLFMSRKLIVLSVELQLAYDTDRSARRDFDDWAKQRKEKQPVSWPSAGSVFKRPVGHYAGALIEQAGCKGMRIGGAEVSELHAGFIVNVGDATANDVLALIQEVKKRVKDSSGVELELEIKIV